MAKFETTVWVNWNTQTFMTPEEHREYVDETLKEDWYKDDCAFDDFLTENYSIVDVFNMDEKKKEQAWQKFCEWCETNFLENEDEYSEETVMVEIDERDLRQATRFMC